MDTKINPNPGLIKRTVNSSYSKLKSLASKAAKVTKEATKKATGPVLGVALAVSPMTVKADDNLKKPKKPPTNTELRQAMSEISAEAKKKAAASQKKAAASQKKAAASQKKALASQKKAEQSKKELEAAKKKLAASQRKAAESQRAAEQATKDLDTVTARNKFDTQEADRLDAKIPYDKWESADEKKAPSDAEKARRREFLMKELTTEAEAIGSTIGGRLDGVDDGAFDEVVETLVDDEFLPKKDGDALVETRKRSRTAAINRAALLAATKGVTVAPKK